MPWIAQEGPSDHLVGSIRCTSTVGLAGLLRWRRKAVLTIRGTGKVGRARGWTKERMFILYQLMVTMTTSSDIFISDGLLI
jgi:hypothetical protein